MGDLDKRAHPGAGEALPCKGSAADRALAAMRQELDRAEAERQKFQQRWHELAVAAERSHFQRDAERLALEIDRNTRLMQLAALYGEQSVMRLHDGRRGWEVPADLVAIVGSMLAIVQ